MRNVHLQCLALLVLGCFAGGCGSAQPPEPRTERRRTGPTGNPDEGDGSGSPWDDLTPDQLSKMVTDNSHARLRELQPDFDVAKLAEYRTSPETAPMLGNRASEALLDLAIVDLVQGRFAEAEGTVRVVRTRAKNRNLGFAGTSMLAEARRRSAGADRDAQQAAVEGALGELPKTRFNHAALVYERYKDIDQVLEEINIIRQQVLSPGGARDLLYLQQVLTTVVNERQTYLRALEAVRLGRQSDPPRPKFAFSVADISKRRAAKAVRVAVWDLGVAPDAFPGFIYRNVAEREDEQDNDGDGAVDNLHGVVSDGQAPQKALYYDPGVDVLSQYASRVRGVLDLRIGLADSDDGQQLMELRESVEDGEGRAALERNLAAVVEWAHGTHLAGTVLDGNGKAKLAIFRSAWAGSRTYGERGPTDEELAAERKNMEQVGEFIRKNDITVVSVGFAFSRAVLEHELRREQGKYENEAALQARLEQVHTQRRESWQALLQACPGALFVVPAGDEAQDVTEFATLPASIDAPNVVAVGAIDASGEWAVFSNSGDRVRLFDLGVEVESTLPNSERVRLSGTAMAAANVANLAGKVMSINAALMPEQVVEIMLGTAVELSAPFTGKVAHEQRAVAEAWTARGRRRLPDE